MLVVPAVSIFAFLLICWENMICLIYADMCICLSVCLLYECFWQKCQLTTKYVSNFCTMTKHEKYFCEKSLKLATSRKCSVCNELHFYKIQLFVHYWAGIDCSYSCCTLLTDDLFSTLWVMLADCYEHRSVWLCAGVCGQSCERSCTLAARLDSLCPAHL